MTRVRVTRSFLVRRTQVWEADMPDGYDEKSFDQLVCDTGDLLSECDEYVDNDDLTHDEVLVIP